MLDVLHDSTLCPPVSPSTARAISLMSPSTCTLSRSGITTICTCRFCVYVPMRVSCRQFTVPLAAVGVDFPFTWYLTPSSRTRRRTRPRRWADAIEELRAPAGGVPRLARGDARQHERLEDRRAPGRGVRARPRCSRRRPAPRLRPRLTCPAARRPVTRVFALGTVVAIDFAQNGRCEMQQPDIRAACETPGAGGLAQSSILLVNTHSPWIADWMPAPEDRRHAERWK